MNCLDWYSVTMHDVTIAQVALSVAERDGDQEKIAYRTNRLTDITRVYAERVTRINAAIAAQRPI